MFYPSLRFASALSQLAWVSEKQQSRQAAAAAAAAAEHTIPADAEQLWQQPCAALLQQPAAARPAAALHRRP